MTDGTLDDGTTLPAKKYFKNTHQPVDLYDVAYKNKFTGIIDWRNTSFHGVAVEGYMFEFDEDMTRAIHMEKY